MKQSTLDALSEPLAEAAALVVSALGSAVLAVLGFLAENAALQTVAAGDTVLGLWLLVAGGVALAAAATVGHRELYPRTARVVRRLGAAGS